MKLLKAYNKSPLLTISQKHQKIQLQACEHSKNINRFRLSEKLEHDKTDMAPVCDKQQVAF